MLRVDQQGKSRVAVMVRDDTVISDMATLLDIVASATFEHECDKLLIYKEQFAPSYYDLRTGELAGLQERCVHLKITLALVGAFEESLTDFIAQANKSRALLFFFDENTALQGLHQIK